MRVKAWRVILTLLLLVGLVAATSLRSLADEAQSLPTMVSSAKTAADHEKIATYYDAAAKDARQRAEQHSKLMQAYESLGGASAAKLHLEEHCEKLAKSAGDEATEYENLANAHREMAVSAAK